MSRGRVLALAAALLIADLAGGAPAGAGTETFGSVTFGPGKHPRRHTLWIYAPAIDRRMVISVSYERNYGPPSRGEIAGDCTVVGRTRVELRPMPVEEFQAGDSYWVTRRLARGELVACDLVFKRMPTVPADGWSRLRVGLSEATTDHASPWVEILSVTPPAGRRLRNGDLVQVDVRATNPTTRTLRLHLSLVEEETGFSPGYSTTDPPALLAPGESARFLRTYIAGCGGDDPERTEWVEVGLFDPETSRLYTVFDGAEIKTTRRHPFSHRCVLQTSAEGGRNPRARAAEHRLTTPGLWLTLP